MFTQFGLKLFRMEAATSICSLFNDLLVVINWHFSNYCSFSSFSSLLHVTKFCLYLIKKKKGKESSGHVLTPAVKGFANKAALPILHFVCSLPTFFLISTIFTYLFLLSWFLIYPCGSGRGRTVFHVFWAVAGVV